MKSQGSRKDNQSSGEAEKTVQGEEGCEGAEKASNTKR
jgi:hypothetical protein